MNEPYSLMLRQRIKMASLFCLVVVSALQWRLFELQVVRHKAMAEAGRIESKRNITWKPDRGVILDRNMRLMVWNAERETLVAHPAKIKDPTGTAAKLAPILGISSETLIKRMSLDRDEVALKRHMPSGIGAPITDLKIEGLALTHEGARHYLKGALAGQVLGYVNIDIQGQLGVEKSEEDSLAGKVIQFPARRLGDRKAILDFDYMREVPLRGADVVLTLDETIQWIAERALYAICEPQDCKAGMAIVMDPETGEVLAMANYPSFRADDVGEYAETGQMERAKNYCITNLYEPGSTLKPFVVAAGLDCGAIQENTLIDCEHGRRYIAAKYRNKPIEDEHPMGRVPVSEVLVHSSNIGVGKIAECIEHLDSRNPSKKLLYDYLRAFGFGKTTGIDLPAETRMVLKGWSGWNLNDLLVIAFGTGPVMVSPIGLARAYCVLANGGKQVTPHVVKGFFANRSGDLYPARVNSSTRVVSEEVARSVRQMLLETVERGTGKRNGRSDWYKVGGKTGTAKKVVNGAYSQSQRVLSFAGFAPADNPRIVVVVMIDEPESLRFGAEAAAPVFRQIVEETLAYLHVTPDFLAPRVVPKGKPRQGNPTRVERIARIPRNSTETESFLSDMASRTAASISSLIHPSSSQDLSPRKAAQSGRGDGADVAF